MAELTITLSRQGLARRQIVVRLSPDEDTMPHEHELIHRRIVEQLLDSKELSESPHAPIQVERIRPAREPEVGCCGGGCDVAPVNSDDPGSDDYFDN